MDKIDAMNLVQQYASAVKQQYQGAQVFLFGSYAKGNTREESDIDIAVVLDDYDDFMATQLELMRLRRSIDSRIEPHLFRKEDFTYSNPIVSEILKEGTEITA